MIRDVGNHKIAYTVLAFVLFAFIVIFLHAWPDRELQRIVAVGMGFFYFIWGIVVHKKNDHINFHVVFEYLAVSVLAISLLLLLLN